MRVRVCGLWRRPSSSVAAKTTCATKFGWAPRRRGGESVPPTPCFTAARPADPFFHVNIGRRQRVDFLRHAPRTKVAATWDTSQLPTTLVAVEIQKWGEIDITQSFWSTQTTVRWSCRGLEMRSGAFGRSPVATAELEAKKKLGGAPQTRVRSRDAYVGQSDGQDGEKRVFEAHGNST